MRRLYPVMVLSAALGCGAKSNGADTTANTGNGIVAVGSPAPNYRAVNLDGDSVSLVAMRGKVVLVNIWATWCHPCRSEIPALQAIHTRYQPRGLELVGVSVDNDGANNDIREFMKEFGMSYAIWRDPEERVSSQFLLVGVPATFLIDKQGLLRWRHTGPVAPNDTSLSSAIERALEGSQ